MTYVRHSDRWREIDRWIAAEDPNWDAIENNIAVAVQEDAMRQQYLDSRRPVTDSPLDGMAAMCFIAGLGVLVGEALRGFPDPALLPLAAGLLGTPMVARRG